MHTNFHLWSEVAPPSYSILYQGHPGHCVSQKSERCINRLGTSNRDTFASTQKICGQATANHLFICSSTEWSFWSGLTDRKIAVTWPRPTSWVFCNRFWPKSCSNSFHPVGLVYSDTLPERIPSPPPPVNFDPQASSASQLEQQQQQQQHRQYPALQHRNSIFNKRHHSDLELVVALGESGMQWHMQWLQNNKGVSALCKLTVEWTQAAVSASHLPRTAEPVGVARALQNWIYYHNRIIPRLKVRTQGGAVSSSLQLLQTLTVDWENARCLSALRFQANSQDSGKWALKLHYIVPSQQQTHTTFRKGL